MKRRRRKKIFWNYLDEKVIEASSTGAGLIIQFDGNLWAGDKIIPNDPRSQNRNGKLFEQFLAIEDRSEIKDQKIRRDQEIKIKDQMLGSRKNSS